MGLHVPPYKMIKTINQNKFEGEIIPAKITKLQEKKAVTVIINLLSKISDNLPMGH